MSVPFVVESLSSLASGLTEIFVTVKDMVKVVLAVNHDVMSTLIQFTTDLFSALWAGLNLLYIIVYTVIAFFADFISELLNFIAALLYLLWKIVILVYSFLTLVYHALECVLYFLWSGGKWTANTLIISGNNLSENGISTWKYFVLSLKDFTNAVIGGFASIGYYAKTVGIYTYDGLCHLYTYSYTILCKVDFLVRGVCNYILDVLYYFLTDFIPSIPLETYIGALITCIMCLICVNIGQVMYSEGLTFPMWRRSYIPRDDDESDVDNGDGRRRGEFSDDEDFIDLTLTDDVGFGDNDDDFSVNSDESDGSVSDSFDEDAELEVDSDSDNESNAASESEMSEINIQLPSGPYDLRRSATPSRFTKNMSSEDLQRVIENEKERRMCVVCQDRSKSVLILPCRHMCLCVECGNHIARSRSRERRKCPLCRTKINTIMNVYI